MAWVTVVLGLCVFALRYASPRPSFDVHRDLFFTGLVIIFAALATAIRHANAPRNFWPLVNVVAGFWLIGSRWVFDPVDSVAAAQVALGTIIVIASLFSLILENRNLSRVD